MSRFFKSAAFPILIVVVLAFFAQKLISPDSPERNDRLPAAMLACIRVPQSIAAVCIALLERCEQLVDHVNYYLLSDLAVCADLAMATTRCAIYNVRVNLKDIDDPQDAASIEKTVNELLSRAGLLIQRVSPRIWQRDATGQ